MHTSLGLSVSQPFASSCACVKYNPSICSPFIHSVVSNDSASGQSPDQTVRMCRLIWAFAVCIYPKTRFRMARPIYLLLWISRLIYFWDHQKFYWCINRNTGASIKFISPSTIFYMDIHVIVICYLGPVLWIRMLREKKKVDLNEFECTVPLELSVRLKHRETKNRQYFCCL